MTQKVERFENYRNLINLCYLVGFGLFLGVQTLGSIMTLPRAVNALQIIAVPLMLLWVSVSGVIPKQSKQIEL